MTTKERNFRDAMTKCIRWARIVNRLNEHGIEMHHKQRLDKITNVRWSGGPSFRTLQDGTCHYVRRDEFSGKTFECREVLKQRGYRWDSQYKVWHRPATDGNNALATAEDLCRWIAERN